MRDLDEQDQIRQERITNSNEFSWIWDKDVSDNATLR